MRLNDVAFGVHAVILSSVTLSMYAQRIWGFQQGCAKVGTGIWAIQAGCLIGVLCMVGVVWARGINGGTNPSGWAWIDVVRIRCWKGGLEKLHTVLIAMIRVDICSRLLQARDHGCKIHSASLGELPKPVNGRLEYSASSAGSDGWRPVDLAACD